MKLRTRLKFIWTFAVFVIFYPELKLISYIIIKNGRIEGNGSTSLSKICKQAGISYSSAAQGKQYFIKGIDIIIIETVIINKIKGRGKNICK
jgi:hypothetical protein